MFYIYIHTHKKLSDEGHKGISDIFKSNFNIIEAIYKVKLM